MTHRCHCSLCLLLLRRTYEKHKEIYGLSRNCRSSAIVIYSDFPSITSSILLQTLLLITAEISDTICDCTRLLNGSQNGNMKIV